MEDYKVIKVKYNDESESSHHLFYKQHKLGKSDSQTSDLSTKTLFVNNIPPYYNEQGIKNVFSTFGKVDHVLIYSKPTSTPFSKLNTSKSTKTYFEDDTEKPNGFNVAYVVFSQEQSVERAIQKPLIDKERVLMSNNNNNKKEPTLMIGMRKWIEDYKKSFVDAKQLGKEINQYMENYDNTKAQKEKEEIDKLNQPDEDGWITVTQKNRKSNLTFTERNIEKIKLKQKKKRQQMQLVNFYSFQMKESKKEYIAQLRKKFEEDKKRIETMKQNRKFKPF